MLEKLSIIVNTRFSDRKGTRERNQGGDGDVVGMLCGRVIGIICRHSSFTDISVSNVEVLSR